MYIVGPHLGPTAKVLNCIERGDTIFLLTPPPTSCYDGGMSRTQKIKKSEIADFIRLEPILSIIQTAIWTGRISKDNPVSLCLVASQESAKSQTLLYYKETKTLKYYSDVTTKPLGDCKHLIETKRLRHLVLLDFVRVLQHGKNVGNRTVSFLGGLMEEGQATIADAGGVQEWEGMPKVGVLMALTPEWFTANKRKWLASGFLTRFVRVCFDYKKQTQEAIHAAIQDGHTLPDPRCEDLPDDNQMVAISPPQAEALNALASQFATIEGVYGFRYHRQMRSLCKALALIDKRHHVTDADVRRVVSWQKFFTGTPVTL